MAFSYAYTNVGGTGDRTTLTTNKGIPIVVTSTLTLANGAFANLCDGGFNADVNDAIQITAVAASGKEIKFDLRNLAGAKVITEFKFYQSTSATHGVWDLQGSLDDSSYTTILSGLTLGGATTNTYTVTSPAKYLYYKLVGVSGTTNATPWLEEFEFKISGDAFVESGNRTATATVTYSGTGSGGTTSNLVDGAYTNAAADSYGFSAETAVGKILKIDFGSGNAARVTGFTWWQQTADTQGTWTFSGSNDDSSYTSLLTGIALGGATRSRFNVTNTTAYRYYKLVGTAGNTSGTPWLWEWEFETEDPTPTIHLNANQVMVAGTQSFTLSGVTKRLVATQTLPLPTQAFSFVPTRHLVSAKTLPVPDQLMGFSHSFHLVQSNTLPAGTQAFRINIRGLIASQIINLCPVSQMTARQAAGGVAVTRTKGDIIIEARPRQAI